MTKPRIDQSVTARFDAAGRAVAAIGPTKPGQTWHVTRLVTSATAACKLYVYQGSETVSNIVDTTRTGESDVSETSLKLSTLETLTFVWSNGTPNATATANIYGTVESGI